MEGNIKIGTIWGIPIGLHLSWFVIFLLLVWSLSSSYFPQEYPNLSLGIYVFLGVITSLLFFASVLAHELGHSWVALRNQIPVKKITLFIFGGVAQIGQEPRSAGVEFWVAIAGPLVSISLGVLFGGLWLLDQGIPTLAAPSLYLMRINFILALFNMIPGFPLDGGRVLRAIIWKFTGSFPRATRAASITGQIVAFGFIGLGFIVIFGGDLMNGLWLAFIGWFLKNAAASAYSQTAMPNLLRGIKVNQVMARECTRVTSLTPISQLVDERILNGGERCFFVDDNGKLQGMLTLRDIAQIPQPKWRFTTTGQAMVPFGRLVRVTPETELLSALQTMDDANVAQVPVVSGDELVGMLSREQVVHYLRTRAELGI
jgi:Zn-dependent protease